MPAAKRTPARTGGSTRHPNSMANLKPTNSVTHGAHSGGLIRQRTEELLVNLSEQLPNASREELIVQAGRMARIERLTAFVEVKGLIRNQRHGTVYAAVDLLSRLEQQFERQHAALLERERNFGSGPVETLAEIVAEIQAAQEQDGDGGR